MIDWRKRYLKKVKAVCMKCKPKSTTSCKKTDENPIHCCYPGQIDELLKEKLKENNPLVDFEHRNWITVTVAKADGTKYRETRYACPAYEQGLLNSICLVNDYKPGTCLGYYCEKWDSADKEVVVKGRFEEKSINCLKKHIKALARLPRKYFIITEKPELLYFKLFNQPAPQMDLDNFITFDDKAFIDKEEIFTDLVKLKILENKRFIITNTPLEQLLSNEDLEENWLSVKRLLLRRHTYLAEA